MGETEAVGEGFRTTYRSTTKDTLNYSLLLQTLPVAAVLVFVWGVESPLFLVNFAAGFLQENTTTTFS